MVVERRAFSRLPCYLQTDQNNRDMFITDDVMFEPERAGFLNGYIGDTSVVPDSDLARVPPINESNEERQKYQLSLGAVLVNPETDERTGGAFYSDLVGQINSNGGLVDDPNRIFATPFYAWTPPIDYDKHINFNRYYWTGDGNAEVNGEYVTKEPIASQTILHEITSNTVVSKTVHISNTAPSTPLVGTLWEDSSDFNRLTYRWNGSSWVLISIIPVDDVPADISSYVTGDYLYVRRTGPQYQRPLMWKWSEGAGRWISMSVVVGPYPDSPTEGMIWEDTTLHPSRILRIYKNGFFSTLNWVGGVPSGIGSPGDYIYDNRNLSDGHDTWSDVNWWRHFSDLSPVDRNNRSSGDQATRPIVEFWAGIESPVSDARNYRNDFPQFTTYTYNVSQSEIEKTNHTTTLYQYRVGTGTDDLVLGFPLIYNQTGEFQFEVTLETDTVDGVIGYRYYRDSITGLAHSIWSKSDQLTNQNIDSNGLADLPKNITSNANHEVLTIASRSKFLRHMTGNIQTQTGFEGNEFGINNFRWTDKNTTIGTTIIDCESSLLRTMATLQSPNLDIPDAIRKFSRDYNRVLVKFQNRLNYMWDNLVISDPTDTLMVTPDEAVDAILTELFIGRNNEFPYFYSDMGNYVETQVSNGIASVYGTSPRPIFIPSSPAKIGAISTYYPERFSDIDGKIYLRGHEGVVIESFGDGRDDVWLALQQRFYDAVSDDYRDETETFSARHTNSNFSLENYYGNSKPTTTANVTDVVSDYENILSPITGGVYLDSGRAVLAYYDGAKFLTKNVLVDDVYYNESDTEYYIYNGMGVYLIDRFNRPYEFDYSQEEYQRIIRREFERWAVLRDADFISHDDYDSNDPFTWNYRSVGIEGHYMGIYTRLYRSVRPHSHPWEIMGYAVEPTWWRTAYPPTSVSSDGTPRYTSSHAMWGDIQNGIYNPLTSSYNAMSVMSAPIPVDEHGELLDPIAAGIVDENKLVVDRKDDTWIYGDGSPVEQEFLNSPNYGFAKALAGYLMKTGIFVDTLWSELFVDVGNRGSILLWKAPHTVHKSTLTRPSINDLPVHLELVNGEITSRPGINSWLSEYTKLLGNNVTETFGDVVRNTEIALCWQCSGFLNQDRTNIETASGVKIPFEDVHTLLHRSKPTNEFFGSGVLVVREGTGYRVFGFDLFDPYFEIEVPVVPISGGQVELRQDFIATSDQHKFQVTEFKLPRNVNDTDTAKLAVLINGLRIKPQHITITDSNTFEIESVVNINAGDIVTPTVLTTQSNPSTRVKQFQVEGVSFPYIDKGSGKTTRIEYGRYFDTAPDVINFMLGYGRKLEADGWVFDDEVSPGVIRDWLYGVKAFARWVLEATSPWKYGGPTNETEFFFSPFSRAVKFQSNFGQVLNIESVQNGAYGIIDKDANPINPDDVFTSRIGNTITLSPNENINDIYGVRMLIAVDQHIIFFSNTTKFNDLIYEPVTALQQPVLRVDAYRSHDWNGRLEADGFIINQGELLPNFEKSAKDFTRFYDRINTLDDPVKRDQARELYGWYPNYYYLNHMGEKIPMMAAIMADDRSSFDYHRGMIHSKGTMRPIIAFSRGTKLGQDNFSVNEDWAWRWCEFGDTRRSLVQFTVNKSDYKDALQVIEFNKENDPYNTMIQIDAFSRSEPNVGRWIVPPISGTNNLYSSYELPITGTTFDYDKNKLYVKLFDTETNFTASRLFHYDPQSDYRLSDPEAVTQLDFIDQIDPARYTDGEYASYSKSMWGRENVGKLWWDHSRLTYVDYRSLLPDYTKVAREWAKLSYFKASVVRNEEYVTVSTFDPYTGEPTNHNLLDGDVVVISGADQDDYNIEVAVTVVDEMNFEFVIQTLSETPGTGNIFVKTGFVDVYEWIESPVPPSGWASYIAEFENDISAPTGTPILGDDTSYVIDVQPNEMGVATEYYYFWVKDNNGTNSKKTMPTAQIAHRLEYPTINNSPWFAVVDREHLITFVNGVSVQNNYALEIFHDNRVLDHHTEWLLISEGDTFNNVPSLIWNKIVDSVSGKDEFGQTIPSPLLSDTEKYGSDTFPPQTIYSDTSTALKLLVTGFNKIFKGKDLNSVRNITGIFKLSDENVLWKRTTYVLPEYQNIPIFDTVATYVIRDLRMNDNRYYDGDLVSVVESSNLDIWDETVVDTIYLVRDNDFEEVGFGGSTLELLINDSTDPDIIRVLCNTAFDILSKKEQNELVFTMLYEMLRQHPEADWFIKTSYITMQVSETISQVPFTRPSEAEAMVANFMDTKPYRTKLRTSMFTYATDPVENMGLQLDEFPDKKISMRFDRLNCSLDDEYGWSNKPWDTEQFGWDKPVWDWSGEGLTEFYSIGVQVAEIGKTKYTFTSPYDPTLYNHTVIVTDGSVVMNLSDLNLSYELTKDHQSVYITLDHALSPPYTIEVQQNTSFYVGETPTLGVNLENTVFEPLPSTYRHHVVRMMDKGIYAPFGSMDACYNDPSESPEERIAQMPEDSVVICVKNEWTSAYAGWDTTPWGTTTWDQAPANNDVRVFFLMAGNQTMIPAGVEVFSTSENVVVTDTRFVPSPEMHRISKVELNGNEVFDGIEFTFVDTMPWVVDFTPRQDIQYIADGATYIFDGSDASYGVTAVYVNNTLQVFGTDYILSGTDVEFVQPAPTLININATMTGRRYEGNDWQAEFETSHSGDSLAVENAFVFIDGVLVNTTDYTVPGTSTSIELNTPPTAGQEVLLFTLGNTNSDNTAKFNVSTFVANGTDVNFVPGNNANNKTAWVFVDGQYQIYGVDYTISVHGTITFLSAPSNGAVIEIRTLMVSAYVAYEMEHIVFNASGSGTDNITGLSNLQADEVIVFAGSVVQNGYSAIQNDYVISTGSPDQIVWNTAPVAGTPITIRIIKYITIDQATFISVYPQTNDIVRIVPEQTLTLGDVVTFYYDSFPVDLGANMTVTGTPTTYDIINGYLILDNSMKDDYVYVTYVNERRSNNPSSMLVRMTNVVDRALVDHTMYDDINGDETNRLVGLRVLDTTEDKIYSWDGSQWVDTGATFISSDQVCVIQNQQILEYTGSSFQVIFNTGDTYTTPPTFIYPSFGRGITSATYALGHTSDANIYYPEAYQIIQHPGDIR